MTCSECCSFKGTTSKIDSANSLLNVIPQSGPIMKISADTCPEKRPIMDDLIEDKHPFSLIMKRLLREQFL